MSPLHITALLYWPRQKMMYSSSHSIQEYFVLELQYFDLHYFSRLLLFFFLLQTSSRYQIPRSVMSSILAAWIWKPVKARPCFVEEAVVLFTVASNLPRKQGTVKAIVPIRNGHKKWIPLFAKLSLTAHSMSVTLNWGLHSVWTGSLDTL